MALRTKTSDPMHCFSVSRHDSFSCKTHALSLNPWYHSNPSLAKSPGPAREPPLLWPAVEAAGNRGPETVLRRSCDTLSPVGTHFRAKTPKR